MTDQTTDIEITGLVKYYKGSSSPAVNDITLNIYANEVFGLLGPNGAGKTTTINVLCGLLPFNSGKIVICGYHVDKDLRKIKQLTGVVPQDIALYPNFTAMENLKIYGGLYGLKGADLRNRIFESLRAFGLENREKDKVKTFSGGMKRRLNIIAGIIHKPKILFLDEPTVGIDVQSRTLIIENLKEINRSGTTMIYTSHQMEEAESFCSRIAIIDNGKLLATGEPVKLISETPGCKKLEDVFLALTGRSLRD